MEKCKWEAQDLREKGSTLGDAIAKLPKPTLHRLGDKDGILETFE